MTTGPSTTTTPYLNALEPNVRFSSILTVGDAVGLKPDGVTPYRMVGIPDGLGAYDNGDGTITVLMNHELGATVGVARAHGAKGAFVSQYVIDKATLTVISGKDAFDEVQLYDRTTESFFTPATAYAIGRLCSADLADVSAYYNEATGLGSTARIFMTGEENGANGKQFAVVVTGAEAGTAYELADFGLFSWENSVSSPYAQDKTVNLSTDDSGGGQVYLYVGNKQATGLEIEKAGLVGGKLYGIDASNIVNETDGAAANGTFAAVLMGNNGDVSNLTGAQLEAESVAKGVTGFLRPEDVHWDTINPAVAYFVTTNNFNGPSRLYKLTFSDIENPELGGTIEAVLDGTEGQKMLDNITVAEDGKVYLQEDPGNQAYISRIHVYDPATDTLTEIAEHDRGRFLAPTAPFSQDEETSGIIDVTEFLGDADTQAFLVDVQAHYGLADPELVQGGQLLAMFVDDVKDGGNGDDRVAGDAGANVLNGNRGNDEMLGGSGNDSLFGGRGMDLMVGGRGSDVLQGGLDADVFLFDTVTNGDVDYITDFLPGNGDSISFGSGVIVTGASVGFLTTGDMVNGQAMANSARGLDLVLTLTQGSNTQTVHILDAYGFGSNSYWEGVTGLDLSYPQPLPTGTDLMPIA